LISNRVFPAYVFGAAFPMDLRLIFFPKCSLKFPTGKCQKQKFQKNFWGKKRNAIMF